MPPKPPDKPAIAINFTPQGVMRSIYKDELLPLFETLGTPRIRRASNVEWEELPNGMKGWTVRAAHDPSLAICTHPYENCFHVAREGGVVVFPTREEALEYEVKFFWNLLPSEDK